MHILALSGSLRKDSFNTALINAFATHAPDGVSITVADISALPLYNQDRESSFPEVVSTLKDMIRTADGILIATPEFNRSVPGVLKNAIDWTSRPYGDSAWKGKPVYVVGASVGGIGTALAQYELKKILLYLDAHVLGQPEFFLGTAGDKFDSSGTLVDEKTVEHITEALAVFVNHIKRG